MSNITRRPLRLFLSAALLALLPVGATAASAAPSAPRSAASKFCSQSEQQQYVATLAAKIKVPAPVVNTDASSATGAYFTPGTSTISVRPGCATKSTLAHEFGHYVVDLAAGMDWTVHKEIAKQFTGFRNWLKTSSDAEGFERAAHCVGYRFVKNGTYTRCPHRKARDLAAYVTAVAAGRYPA